MLVEQRGKGSLREIDRRSAARGVEHVHLVDAVALTVEKRDVIAFDESDVLGLGEPVDAAQASIERTAVDSCNDGGMVHALDPKSPEIPGWGYVETHEAAGTTTRYRKSWPWSTPQFDLYVLFVP